jgi:hypothetical protein
VLTHPETQARLALLFTRINQARSERNTYVHGLWTAGPEPRTADVMTIKWERAELMKRELVTQSDLEGLLTEIGEIHVKLGFHPIAGTPKRKRTLKSVSNP